jgi:hypothetical protein
VQGVQKHGRSVEAHAPGENRNRESRPHHPPPKEGWWCSVLGRAQVPPRASTGRMGNRLPAFATICWIGRALLAAGDVVIIPAVDRRSRDTTDLMVLARDMQRAGAGLRSLAEPVLDTTGDFGELVLAMLGVAAKLERRRIAERTARGRADAKANGVQFGRKPSLTPHQQQEVRKRIDAGRDTAQHRPHLQCKSGDDFEVVNER